MIGRGNPWRGMLHGSVVRMQTHKRVQPCEDKFWHGNPICSGRRGRRRPPMQVDGGHAAALWGLWDSFGIEESTLKGWWEPGTPVRAARCKNVMCSTYVKRAEALVVLASFDHRSRNCSLSIDWKALGLRPEKAIVSAPEIAGVQPAVDRFAGPAAAPVVAVEPLRGWFLRVSLSPDRDPSELNLLLTLAPTM